ncbi:MAG: protein kinase [Planctomycetota bacterium]
MGEPDDSGDTAETVYSSLDWLREGQGLPPLSATVTSMSGGSTLAPERGEDQEVVLDHYQVVDELGAGGMGVVYLARDSNLGRKVALKCARNQGDEEALRRFVLEAQVTALLDHPGVVPVYALEVAADGAVAYTMKPIEGRDLKTAIRELRERYQQEGLSPKVERLRQGLLERFVRVCEAVAFAHSREVVHRDLKPENVMLGEHHEVYVVDWGLAKVTDEAASPEAATPPALEGLSAAERTHAGIIKGTPLYMAPEQARGYLEKIGPASDQYSLGLTLYELLYLQRARSATDAHGALVEAWDNTRREPPDELDTSPELRAIWERATAKETPDRYPSVAALAEDVRCALRGEETQAYPDRGWRKLRRWIQHHPQLAAWVVVGAGALLVGGWVYTGLRARERRLAAQRAAEAREAALSDLAVGVTRGARSLALTLADFEGHARALGAAAEEVLLAGVSEGGVAPTPPEAFDEPAPELGCERSAHYGGRWIAPRQLTGRGPAGPELLGDLALLGRLYPRLRAPYAEGSPSPEEVDRRILEHQVPVEWTYVAAERSGAVVFFPGSRGQVDPTYDPRQRPWYQEAVATHRGGRTGPSWSTPYVDQLGQGTVMTCCQVLARGEDVLGVAALDVSLGQLAGELQRSLAGVPGFRSATLLDGELRPIVSDDAGAEAAARVVASKARVDAQEEGVFELEGRFVAWSHVPGRGWLLAVEVDAAELLAASGAR